MIFIKNNQKKIKVSEKALTLKAKKMLAFLKYQDFDLNIWLTTNATIKRFNNKYRGKNKPTDILSFPYHELKAGETIKVVDPDDKNLGDIIISLEYVQKDAPNWKQTFVQRLHVLLAHGVAHLLGYDHQTEDEFTVMNNLEKKLLSKSS